MKGVFYHWSPKPIRNRIRRVGLMPGSLSRDGAWRPPYVCLAPSPQIGWVLSGGMQNTKEHWTDHDPEYMPWDLWEVWIGDNSGYEELYFDNGNLKEIRVYERIYKRNVWLVGSR